MGVNYWGRDLQDFPRFFKNKKVWGTSILKKKGVRERKENQNPISSMSGGKGEKENMFYITGVLITGFSPEKPELRHEKALVLSPCFLSLIAILFSFLLGMFFLDFFLSLPKVYHITVCSSFDLIFLRISFFPWEKIEFNAIQLPDFFLLLSLSSLSLSLSLSPTFAKWYWKT